MRPSLAQLPGPILAAILQEATPNDARAAMRNAMFDGAHAFALDMGVLEQQYLNETDLERIFLFTDKPFLAMHYRKANVTEEELPDIYLTAVRAGVCTIDLMGDLFDPSPLEITRNPAAIDKQRALIDQIHGMGVEVLMSSHTKQHMSTEQVLEHAHAIESRGVDIVKIVEAVHTEEELHETLRTTMALKKELKVPFIHLSGGQWSKLHRYMGPMLGAALTFCVPQYTARNQSEQPLLRAAKAVYDNLELSVNRMP